MNKINHFTIPLSVFGFTLIVSVLLWVNVLPDPIFIAQIDLGNLIFIISLIGAVSWIMVKWWKDKWIYEAAENTRKQANNEHLRFLSRLDHEIKNPITAVRAGLANLGSEPNENLHGEAIASIEAQTLRLSRLASNLRKLADLENRPLDWEKMDIAALLQEAYELAENQPGADGRTLRLTLPQVPWPLPQIQADRDLLFLAVHNLMDNAIKFSQPGNTIEVRALEDGTHIVVEVADTGPGIPQNEINHVWEELYRGEGARSIPGSGLGLSLVRVIVTRHSGQVNLRSRPGQGTVVTMRLPISHSSTQQN